MTAVQTHSTLEKVLGNSQSTTKKLEKKEIRKQLYYVTHWDPRAAPMINPSMNIVNRSIEAS